MPLTLLLSLVAAWPVDMVHDVEAGREKLVVVSSVDWAESEDSSIASVEVMESGEILVTGVKAGRTLILLHAQGRFAVWRVRVGQKPVLGRPESVKRACPDATFESEKTAGEKTPRLVAKISSEGCFKALREFFESDSFVARDCELTFDVQVLQTQLRQIQSGLPNSVTAKYVGAGLVLDGSVSEPEQRKLMWMIFRRTVGRVPLENRMEIKERSHH